MKRSFLYLITVCLLPILSLGQNQWEFQNLDLSLEKRVDDLMNRLYIEEKISMLISTAEAIPRLEIENYYHGNEALHGVVKGGRFTVFPQAVALASTWNPNLIYQVSTAISDDVRGDFESLEKAVLTKGWSSLNRLKGKFLFVLDEKEERINEYLLGHESLKEKVLFVNSKEGNAEAGFRIVNNPVKELAYIKELVSKGYMVRTRADAGTKEARTNDYEKFEKAKASGAQVISTDYYMPSTLFDFDFKVIFEDGTYEKIKKK